MLLEMVLAIVVQEKVMAAYALRIGWNNAYVS